MFVDDFNLYDISGISSNSLKEGEDKYETLTSQKNDNKDEKIYYNFCYDLKSVKKCGEETYEKKQILGVKDEIGEDNTNSRLNIYSINL